MARRFFFIALLPIFGCRAPLPRETPPPPPPAVVAPLAATAALVRLEPSQWPSLADDADLESLRQAALQSVAYFSSQPPESPYVFGPDVYTARELASGYQRVADIAASTTTAGFRESLLREFSVYQSVGTDPKRTVTFSSYFEPTIPARIQRTDRFRFPLYARPDDLIDVELGRFNPALAGNKVAGRRVGNNLVPYYTRREIDSTGALKSLGRVLAYAQDPVDVFSLQTEGSGWLDVGSGENLRIRYAGNNGHKYRSVGQYLITSGRVKKDGFGHDAFVRYMSAHPKERQDVLNVNDRYVFFQLDRSTTSAFAYGNIEVPLTAGRSIATDPKLFPKGALAWVTIQNAPVLGGGLKDRRTLERFMFNQDEGGAIQGPGRVDFFAGHGKAGEQFATHLWQTGALYFVAPKKS